MPLVSKKMKLGKRVINYWYRHPLKEYFSIENVFTGLEKKVNENPNIIVKKKIVPHVSGSLSKMFGNIKYGAKADKGIHHITGDIYYITPFLKGKKIVTFHDFVLYRRTSNKLKKLFFEQFWYKIPFKYADIITVISPEIKKELLQIQQIDERKIIVIPNYYNPYFNTIKKFDIATLSNPIQKILCIGTNENKNLSNSILAIAGTDIEINIVGKSSEIHRLLIEKNNVKAYFHENISDEELGRLYQTSSCLLYPSLYEGFGLPIIEAQSVGLPVITSNKEPMKWVAGTGAELVNPDDVESIRKGIFKVLNDQRYTQSLIINGSKNIQRFELNTIAAQYIQCYEKCFTQQGST